MYNVKWLKAVIFSEERDSRLQEGAASLGVQSAKTPMVGRVLAGCCAVAVETPVLVHKDQRKLKSIQPVFLHGAVIEERQRQPYEMHFFSRRCNLEASESRIGL